MKTTLLSLFIALFCFSTAKALAIDPPTSVKVVEVDFPLFKDKDYRILYIDFELLNTNVKSLKVKKAKNISFQDDVSTTDVDAIYEIDYSDYEAGEYTLELHTYSGKVLQSSFIIE